MKVKTIISISLLAAMVSAAQTPKIFSDKGDNMSIEGWTSFSIKSKENQYTFFAKGSPVKGVWAMQNLTVNTEKLEGIATSVKGKRLSLISATMTGSVHAVTTKPSTADKTKNQIVDMKSSSASYIAATTTMDLTGGVKIVNTDDPASRSMTFSGSTATVVMNPQSKTEKDLIRSALVKGPVSFVIDGVDNQVNEKTKKAEKVPVHITGSCNTLSYDASKRQFRLIGNVTINGADPIFGGDIQNVDEATIVVDQDWKPIEIEMHGNPGSSTIRQKKGAKD